MPCVAQPNPGLNFSMGANVQIYDQSNPTTSGLLNLQTWTGGSSIDASTGGNLSASGLLLNYWCGNNTFINTGANGGSVYTGDQLFARKNVQIGNPGPSPIDANVSLNLFMNGTNSGLKLWSGAIPTVKLIHDNYDQFMVMGNGKTSIGVNATPGATPYKTLTVNGDASFANYGAADGANAFEILGNNQAPTNRGISVDNSASGNVNFFLNSNTSATGKFKFKNGTGPGFDLMTLDLLGKLSTIAYGPDAIEVKNFGLNKVVFEVLSDGRTRIGTGRVLSRPTSSLTVSGEIDCKSLFVLKPTTWSDYVFAKEHKLDDLKTEEEYILKNNHLKGIPSEKEVLENGYDINEMNAALLAKLEGAYLHIIKLQKEVDELKKKL